MNRPNDVRIEAFRQMVERLNLIPGQLDTLAITLHRADELPGLIAKASYRLDRQWLEEEQTALGNPMTLRIRQVQLENELRQGLASVGESLRAAMDAAKSHVTTAAGGADAVQRSPLACRHLSLLTRYSSPLSATETIRLRLGLLTAAWQAIDAALDSLCEIRFDASRKPGPI
jgi:hypothetical protein